jgi:hypothetical protein
VRRLFAAVSVLALSVGCSASHGAKREADRAVGSQAATICAEQAAAKRVSPPAGFPADFPIPPGTVLTSAADRGSAGLVVSGISTASFKSVLAALHADLPKHGFKLEDGETEPRDAESDWSSAQYTGRWAIRDLPRCPGETLVSVVARKR